MWNQSSESRADKVIGASYYSLITKLLISLLVHFIIFLIIQVIDSFIEYLNYNEELYIFFYLKFFFFGVDLLSLLFLLILNILFFSSMDDKSKSNIDYAKDAYFSYVKLNFTLFILWTILLLATEIPRLIIFLLNKEKFGLFLTVLIYAKLPFIILIYLHSIVIYVLYKEAKVEEFGHESGFY